MLDKYSLVIISVNLNGGVSATIDEYDTYKLAESKWRDKLSQIGGNPQTAYAIFEILDLYGRVMEPNYYIVDNTVPKPQYVEIVDPIAVAEDGKEYYVLISNEYVLDNGVQVGDRVYGKYVEADD